MPVSADHAISHGPRTRAKSRGSRSRRATFRERRTVCWREMDSNHQYRERRAAFLSREGRLFPSPGNQAEATWDALETLIASRGTNGSNPLPASAESDELPPWRPGL